jgi:hypothetical protein
VNKFLFEGRISNQAKVFIHFGDVTDQTAHELRKRLYPHYSQDISPPDFYLLGKLKHELISQPFKMSRNSSTGFSIF